MSAIIDYIKTNLNYMGEASQIPYLTYPFVQSMLLLAVFFILYKIFSFIIERLVGHITEKHKEKLDEKTVKEIRRPLFYAAVILAVEFVILPWNLSPVIENFVITFSNTFLYMIAAWIIINTVDIIIKVWGMTFAKKTKSSLDDELLPIFRKFSTVVIIIIVAIMILGDWGVNVSGIVAGLGIAGLALGFALKDSLANIFGGISLIFDRAFKVGDVIKLDSGEMGEVIDIGIRSTKMKTWDNEMLTIPNGGLSNAIVMNYKRPDISARIVIDFGVEYGSDHKKVKKVVIDTIKKLDKERMVLDNDKKEPNVYFMSMGDSSLNFSARFWVKDFNEKFGVKEKATCAIYDALNNAKIGIPFPTRTIYNITQKKKR